jgi:hypothetical protein
MLNARFYVYQDSLVILDPPSNFCVKFSRPEDAAVSARQANRQLADGEAFGDVCRRLKNWAHDLRLEHAAADEEHVRYAD